MIDSRKIHEENKVIVLSLLCSDRGTSRGLLRAVSGLDDEALGRALMSLSRSKSIVFESGWRLPRTVDA